MYLLELLNSIGLDKLVQKLVNKESNLKVNLDII